MERQFWWVCHSNIDAEAQLEYSVLLSSYLQGMGICKRGWDFVASWWGRSCRGEDEHLSTLGCRARSSRRRVNDRQWMMCSECEMKPILIRITMNVIVDGSDIIFTILSSQYWFLEMRNVSAYDAQGFDFDPLEHRQVTFQMNWWCSDTASQEDFAGIIGMHSRFTMIWIAFEVNEITAARLNDRKRLVNLKEVVRLSK